MLKVLLDQKHLYLLDKIPLEGITKEELVGCKGIILIVNLKDSTIRLKHHKIIRLFRNTL
jgi:hypothetical protein